MHAERAAAAEQAVLGRHLQPVWGVPGTALGRVAWPPSPADRGFVRWTYWWQAHLLDCLLDAEQRAPNAGRRRRIAAMQRGHRLRNLGVWTNRYHDDMAWLGLAMLRAGRHDVARHLGRVLAAAWDAGGATGGGMVWRRGDTVRNAPANGPAGILLARLGDRRRAGAIADWLEATLVDPGTGLVLDGIRADGGLDRQTYTYCSGVTIGLEVELAHEPVHRRRAHERVEAVATHLAPGGVLVGDGDGDGGLFAGITARYLALAAGRLPSPTAARIVRSSADAAWDARDGDGRFRTAWADGRSTAPPDLSVQLSGWMALEAAAALERG